MTPTDEPTTTDPYLKELHAIRRDLTTIKVDIATLQQAYIKLSGTVQDISSSLAISINRQASVVETTKKKPIRSPITSNESAPDSRR